MRKLIIKVFFFTFELIYILLAFFLYFDLNFSFDFFTCDSALHYFAYEMINVLKFSYARLEKRFYVLIIISFKQNKKLQHI